MIKNTLLSILVLLLASIAGAQTAAFTTSPAAVNGVVTICQGQSITYTNTSTGTNNSTNYNWTFQGGNPNNSNSIGPHTVTYSNSGNFNTTLNLGGGNSVQISVNVINTSSINPQLVMAPGGGQYSTTSLNGVTIFRKCGGLNIANFTFNDPNLSSYPAGSTFNYAWGDGTSSTGPPSSIFHSYVGQGYYNLVYTVNLPSGCSVSVTYQVYVGANPPAITLSGTASTSCLPNEFSFELGSPQNTTPPVGTTYVIIYNDGSPNDTVSALTSNPMTIEHLFTQTSCGINSVIQSTTYTNSYSIQVVATNGCNILGTFAAIGPIIAAESVDANLSVTPNTNTICINTPLTFNDISDPGSNVYATTCDVMYGRYWTISPNSGFTTTGTLGANNGFMPNSTPGYDWASWTNGAQNLPVTWTVPGNYQVTLFVGNDCGVDSVTYNVCVVAPTLANFAIPTSIACSPLTLTPTNNSSTPGCNNSNFYNWSILSSNPLNCTVQNGPSVNPSSSTSASPSFTFSGPGAYTIQLITGLNTSVLGAACAADTFTQVITIKSPPQVTIAAPAAICSGSSFTPVATVNNCYSTSPVTYLWNFNPNNTIPSGNAPTPLTSTLLNPGAISYPSSQGSPFPFQLTATNECGSTTASQTITVQPGVVVTPGTYGPFCVNSTVQLAGQVTGGSTTGYWTANVLGGSFSAPGTIANSGALNSIYTPPSAYTGTIVLTLTSGAPPSPCPVVTAQTSITFNSQATSNAGTYATCMDQGVTLNGVIGGAASTATWTATSGTFSNVNSLTSSWTPPSGFVGTAQLTLTTNDPSGPCQSATSTATVTVKPLPVATVAATIGSICSGANAVFNLTSSLPSTSYNWTIVTLPPGVVVTASGTISTAGNGLLSLPIANNTSTPQTLTFQFTPVANGCSGQVVTSTVTIQPVATVLALSSLTVCPGATITPTTFQSTPTGSTFAWSNSNTAIGTSASGSGQLSSWTAPVNNGTTAITGTITVTPTFNGCLGTSSNFTVTISPTPVVTNTNLSQAICSGATSTLVTWTSNLTATTFNWTATASSVNLSGFTTSGSGNLPTMTITNSGNTVETVTYSVTPSKDGCSGIPVSYVITVNPIPALTLSPNQTVCGGINTVVTTFTNSVIGGSFTYALQNPAAVPATISGFPTTGAGQIPASTINNGGTNAYTLNYTITPNAFGCSGPTGTYSITINPAPVATFSQANQVICTGNNTSSVTLSSTTSNVTFSWSAQNPLPTGIGNLSPTTGTNTIPAFTNLINTTISPISVTFTALATTSGTSQCPGAPSNYTITVNPSPNVQASFTSNDTLCSAQSIGIQLSSTVLNTTFTWTATNGAGISGGANSTAPSSVISQVLTNTTSSVGFVNYSITPSANGCSGAPITVTAYVNPVAVLGSISTITVCSNTTVSIPSFVSVPANSSIAWTSNQPLFSIGTSGLGSISPWTAPVNNGTTAIIGNFTVTPTFNNCPGTPRNFSVTVQPSPSVTNTVLTQSICSGVSTVPVNWSSGISGATFSWTAQASSANVSGFPASGNGNLAALTGIINSGNTTETVTFSVTATANGCAGSLVNYVLTVYPTPTLTLSPSQTICSGNLTSVTSFTNSVSTGSITWQTNPSVTIPPAVTGFTASGTGQLPAMTLQNTGTLPFNLVYNVTPSANGCNGALGQYTITINPAPSVQFSQASQTICSGANTTQVNVSSTTPGVTFGWQATVPSGINNFVTTSGTGNIPAFTNLVNTTVNPITIPISVTPTTAGSALCPGTTAQYSITVNPTPVAAFSFVSNDTICSGGQLNINLTANTSNTLFTWTAINGAGVSGASSVTVPQVSIQQQLTNSSTLVGNAIYTVTPQSGACSGQAVQIAVYVNPVALTNPVSALTFCAGEQVVIPAFSSTPTGAVFSWTNSNTAVGLSSSGTGNISAFAAPVNTTNSSIVSTIQVTPTFNGCPGTPASFTLSIKPTPSITNQPLTQTICSGSATTAVQWSSGVTGTTYAWTSTSSSVNLTGYTVSGNGNLPQLTGIQNAGNTTETISYTVTPTAAGCAGTSISYTVVVNPLPVLTLSSNQTLCSGVPTLATQFVNSVSAGSFVWNLQNPLIIPSTISGYQNSGTGQLPSATLTNSGTSSYQLNYSITPTANGCSGSALVYSITVLPAPAVAFSIPSQSICNGNTTQSVTLSSATPNVNYTWSAVTPLPAGIGNLTPSTGTTSVIPSYSNLTNSTSLPIVVTFTAQATTSGSATCPGQTANYTITVNPTAVGQFSFSSNDSICNGGTLSIALTSITPNTQFTWTQVASLGISGAANSVSPAQNISQVLTNTASTVGSITYTITPVLGTCNGSPIQAIGYVNPVAQLSPLAAISACPNAAFNPPPFAALPSGSSFTWTNTNQNIGLAQSGNGQLSPWTAPVNNSTASITSTVTVTPVFNTCLGTPASFGITLFPTPSITNSPLNQTLCEGIASSPINLTSSLSGSTLTWSFANAGTSLSGMNTSSGNNPLPAMTISNNGNTQETVVYSVQANSTNNCTSPATQYTININPNPTLSGVVDQTICSGSVATATNYQNSVQGGGFTWSLLNTGIPSTVTNYQAATGSGQVPSSQISNTGPAPYTLNYLITPTAVNCAGVADTFSITIMPSPAVQFVGGNSQTLCSGLTTTPITLTSTTPNVTWNWTVTAPSGVSGALPASGQTQNIPAFTLSHTASTAQTVTLSVSASTLTNSCPGTQNTYSIIVNPIPVATATIVGPTTICSNNTLTVNLTSTVSNTNFTWTSTASQGITGNTIASGTSIVNTLINSSTTVGTVNYTISPAASGCSGSPTTATVFVNPVAVVIGLSNLSSCPGGQLAPSTFQSNPPNATYNWTNTNAAIGILSSGSGNIPSWNAPANGTGTTVTGTINVTPTYAGCVGSPSSFTATIFPTPSVTNSPLNQTVCEGASTASVNFTSSLIGSVLNWSYVSAGNSLSAYNTSTGTSNLPSMAIGHSGSTQQSVIYSVQAISTNSCPSTPVQYTVFVNPNPIISGVQDQTVCSGAPTALSNFQNSVTGGNFSWTLLNTGIPATVNGYLSVSSTGQIPSATITNTGASAYTLNYLVTPTATGCTGIADTLSITVMPSAVVLFTGGNSQAICSGNTSVAVSMSSPTPNVTWSWSLSAPGAVSGALPSNGLSSTIPAYTLSQNGTTSLNVVFTVNASTTLGSCPGGQATYTITVNPTPIATAVFASNDTVCSNSPVTLNLSSTVAGTSFSWSSIASSGVTGNTNASGQVINNTLVNSTGLLGTVNYTITPTASLCPGTPVNATAAVNPVAVMTGLVNISACPGGQLTPPTFQSNPPNATFTWVNSNPSIGISSTGTGSIASWTAPTNQTTSALTGTVAVTPTYNNGCAGVPSTFTVTIHPTPQVTTTPMTQTLCESVVSQSVNFASNIPSTINWTYASSGSNISGYAAGTGENPLPSMTFSNTGSTQQAIVYSVQASTNAGCQSIPANYTFNVNPTPVLVSPGGQTVCSGAASTSVSLNADVTGATYLWNAVNPPVGLSGFTPNGGGSIPSMTIVNSTANSLQLVYNVTPSAGGCNGSSVNYTFTINPSPTINFSSSNQSLCSGNNSTAVLLTTSTQNASISWTAAVPSGITGFSNTTGTSTIPSFNLVNNTTSNLIATISALATTTGSTACPGTTATYTITVSPQIGFTTVVADNSLCSGEDAQIQLNSSLAGITYSTVVNASAGISGASNVNGLLIDQTLTNASNTQGSVSYSITANAPAGNICPNQATTIPITVEPISTVQYSLPNQVVCSGTNIQSVNLSSSVIGSSIAWTATTPIGISGMQASGTTLIPSLNLTNSTNAPLNVVISATSTINGCPGPVATYQITVHPNPTLTITPSIQTICSGTSFVSNLSSNVANTSFNWVVTPNPALNGTANGTGNAINQTLVNSTAQLEQVSYTVTTVGPGPIAGCPGQTGILLIAVNPVPTVVFNQSNQTICSGTSNAQVLLSSVTSNAQISWSAAIPAGITGATANGTTTIPVQNLVNTTNTPLSIVYTSSVSTNTGNCSGQSSTYSITVNPLPALSFSQGNQVICSGLTSASVNLQTNLAPTVPGTLNYSWTAVQPSGISGVVVSGSNTIPAQTLVNSSNSPLTINYTGQVSYTNNNTICTGTGANYAITVNPLPAVLATVTDPIICSGDTAQVCFTSPVSGVSFSYTVLTSNGITGASNGTGTCFNQALVNNLLAQGSATYTVQANSNGCSGTSTTATVLVNPLPVVSPLTAIVVCPSQSIAGINFISTPPGATFNWSNSNPSIGLSSSGIGPISGWLAPANSSGGSYVGTVSVNSTLSGCTGPNTSFNITVNPTPSLDVTPQLVTICSGQTANLSFVSNVPNASFSWTVASTNVNGASNGSGGNGSFTLNQNLIATGSAVGNAVYTVTPQANTCFGNPIQVPVIVNPNPNVLISPSSQTLCSGETTALSLSSDFAGTTFGWTVSTNAAVAGAFNGSGNVIQQVLSNSSVLPQLVTYTVTPSLNGCNGTPVSVTVSVNPTPVVSPSVLSQTICSGQSTNILLNANVSSTTFNYTFVSNPGILGANNGTTSPILQQLTNTTSQAAQVVYTIIPTANTCVGNAVSVTVTVNPVATVIPSATQLTFCSGQNAVAQLSSNVAGATFNWTVTPNAQLTGQSGGNGNTINQQVTNNSFLVQNYNYVITPAFGSCPGTQYNLPVTVNPLPQIFAGAQVNTCISNQPFLLSGYTPTGGTWQGTGITNSVTGEFSPPVAGVGQFNLVYTYTNPATGCTNSGVKVVQVNPLPVPQFTMDTLKCTNTNVTIVNNSIGSSSYFWEFGNGATSTVQNPIYQFPQGGTYTVQLTATSPQGCVDSISQTITIITNPITSFVPTSNLGCGPLDVNFANTTTGSYITSYFWNFGYPANGPFSIQQNPGTITFPSPYLQDTSYIVSLSATNQCGTTSYLDTIVVKPTPIATFGTSVSTGCSPLSVNFLNTSIGSPTNFIWSFGDGSFSTQPNPSHVFTTPTNDTTFNVMLIAINDCGSDTTYFPIYVLPNTVTSFFNTNPTSGCSPLDVDFTNFSLGSTTYYWNFGDGQVSNTQSPSHVYTGAGNYTAQLIASNGCAYDTSNISITVFPKPNVSFNVQQNTLCTNENFVFVNSSVQLSNVVWSFGDGTGSNVYSPTHDYSTAGTFVVSLVGSSSVNGCLDTAYQTINVIQGPDLQYDEYVFEGCLPQTIQFNELSNTATSAVWDFDDGTQGIGPSATHTFTSAGTFAPVVIAQNAFGCADTATFTVVIHPNPIAAFQLSDVAICDLPVDISTNNLSQGAVSYSWDFDNGTTSVLNAPQITYVQSGMYQVSLIAYNQFGCSDTAYENVNVLPRPVANFTPDLTSGCEDLTINFTNTSSGATSYLWEFGDSTSVQAVSPGHTYYNPGTYSVSLIAYNDFGCADTITYDDLINVFLVPQAGFSVSPAEFFIDEPLISLINTANLYETGEYIFGTGEIYDISTMNYNFNVPDSGNYMITQIVYTETGCVDTATAWVHVSLAPTLYVPNAFTPDLDGENDEWIPVASGFKSITVRVFNRWGEEIFVTNDLTNKWDGTYLGLPCQVGVYTWSIYGRDENDELIIKHGHVSLVR
jgi:gliding motility-associated-like protein